MRSIVLIRHVETDMAGRFCGHSDPEPNHAGVRQMEEITDLVAPLGIEHIFSSDLRRATMTAERVGRRLNIPVEQRPGLREIHFGAWEGMSWEEITAAFPDEAAQWIGEFPLRSPNGGEPYEAFNARVREEMMFITAALPCSTIAVVTHRGFMQSALTRMFDFSESEARARTENYGSVIILNDTDLLAHQTSTAGPSITRIKQTGKDLKENS